MLPIDAILPELLQTLARQSSLVLQAPPGSGKTTRVPLALLSAEFLGGRKIVMLEPRRLAARSAARYMASLLGEEAGKTVGYRTRLDTKVGRDTRIEVVTEGILTRLLQDDATLNDYGAVIFDEFHERSLQADLGLALARECQQVLREDLRLVVMSATLDAAAMARVLGDAPVLRAEDAAKAISSPAVMPRTFSFSSTGGRRSSRKSQAASRRYEPISPNRLRRCSTIQTSTISWRETSADRWAVSTSFTTGWSR